MTSANAQLAQADTSKPEITNRVAQAAQAAVNSEAGQLANGSEPTFQFSPGEYDYVTAYATPAQEQQTILNWLNQRNVYTSGGASDPAASHFRAILQASAEKGNGELLSTYIDKARHDAEIAIGDRASNLTNTQVLQLSIALFKERRDAARNGYEEYTNPITKIVEDLHCEGAYDVGFVQGFMRNEPPVDTGATMQTIREAFSACIDGEEAYLPNVYDAGRNDGAFAKADIKRSAANTK